MTTASRWILFLFLGASTGLPGTPASAAETTPAAASRAAAEPGGIDGRSGESIRIYPDSRVIPGVGYATMAGVLRGPGVERSGSKGSTIVIGNSPGEKPEQVDAGVRHFDDLRIEYDFRLVESTRDLASALGFSASASFRSLVGGASARMSLFRTSSFSSYSVYVLARVTVTNGVDQLVDFRLRKEAVDAASNPERFYSLYGDAFVHRVATGSELVALLEYQASSASEREEQRLSIEGKFGSFQAGADMSSSVSSITTGKNVRVHYAQTGGATGRDVTETGGKLAGGVLTLSGAELERRVRDFPAEARAHPENARVLWADLLDYGVCENRPVGFKLPDTMTARRLLEDLGEFGLALHQIRGTWATGVGRAASPPPASTTAPSWSDVFVLDEYLLGVQRTIEDLTQKPSRSDAFAKSTARPSVSLRTYLRDLQKPTIETALEAKLGPQHPYLTEIETFVLARTPPAQLKGGPVILGDRVRSGVVTVGAHGDNSHRIVNVKFEPKFSSAPVVVASVSGNVVAHNDMFEVSVVSTTADGAQVAICRRAPGGPIGGPFPCMHWGNGSIALNWIAMAPN